MAKKEECIRCTRIKNRAYGLNCSYYGRQPNYDDTLCPHYNAVKISSNKEEDNVKPDAEKEGESQVERRCPFCGEVIAPAAIKCKHCKTWLDPSRGKIVEPVHIDFSSRELTFIKKLISFSWVYSKEHHLKRFRVDGDDIYIETQEGPKFSASLSKCKFFHTGSGFHYITVESGWKEISFAEIPFMFSFDEWEVIISFCLNAQNSEEHPINKIALIKDTVTDIINFFTR